MAESLSEAALQAYADYVRKCGPVRVLIQPPDNAVSPLRARRDFGIVSDIIFIRTDGWSLGAPRDWVHFAERIWPDQWVAVLKCRSDKIVRYGDWKRASHG